eukprot:7746076-Alexandrium_andersonii.AAC.1
MVNKRRPPNPARPSARPRHLPPTAVVAIGRRGRALCDTRFLSQQRLPACCHGCRWARERFCRGRR